jgi:hypothetical protein
MEDEGHDKLVKRAETPDQRIERLENRVRFLCTVLTRVMAGVHDADDIAILEQMGRADGNDQETPPED